MKEYCIICVDNISGLEEDLSILSCHESTNILVGPNNTAMVATFFSELEISEMYKMLNVGGDRTFFIFELNNKYCAVHIDSPPLHKLLFSDFLNREPNDNLHTPIIDDIKKGVLPQVYNENKLIELDDSERAILIDQLLNNVETLNADQKKILNFLASL